MKSLYSHQRIFNRAEDVKDFDFRMIDGLDAREPDGLPVGKAFLIDRLKPLLIQCLSSRELLVILHCRHKFKGISFRAQAYEYVGANVLVTKVEGKRTPDDSKSTVTSEVINSSSFTS